MVESNEDTKRESAYPSLLQWFIAHPWVSFIGSVSSVISIPLAFYFYFKSEQNPNVLLSAQPVRTPIVQSGKLSQIQVSLHGQNITGDLTAAQFAVWNSGKGTVLREDILEPLFLIAPSNCPIYEATIRNVSRDVIGITLKTNEMANGRLGFDWKILEEGDGFSIQIIYGGDKDVKFSSVGSAKGQKRIDFKVAPEGKPWILGILSIIGCIIYFAVMYPALKSVTKAIRRLRQEGEKIPRWYYVIMIVIFGGGTGFILMLYAINIRSWITTVSPPFDF